MKYVWFFFSLILVFNSCSKDDETVDKPLYINCNIDNITSSEEYIIGDSAEITFYYTVETPGYSFNEFTYKKLEKQDVNLVDNYLIEIKLINDGNAEVNVQDSKIWKFLPTNQGSYGINYINVMGDTIQELFQAKYKKTYELNMVKEDYQIIVDSVANNPELEQYVDGYGTGELYFGSDSYYENFDLRIERRISSGQTEYEYLNEEEAINLVWKRLIDGLKIVLQEKFKNADKYEKFIIQFNTYNYNVQTYKVEFVSKPTDNTIEFEYLMKELVDK